MPEVEEEVMVIGEKAVAPKTTVQDCVTAFVSSQPLDIFIQTTFPAVFPGFYNPSGKPSDCPLKKWGPDPQHEALTPRGFPTTKLTAGGGVADWAVLLQRWVLGEQELIRPAQLLEPARQICHFGLLQARLRLEHQADLNHCHVKHPTSNEQRRHRERETGNYIQCPISRCHGYGMGRKQSRLTEETEKMKKTKTSSAES